MNQVILITFVLAIAFIPYSHGQCVGSDKTVTNENGIVLGACYNEDSNKGKKFTYVDTTDANGDPCCEARTGRFRNTCINYSICYGGGGGGAGGNGGGPTKVTGDGKGDGGGPKTDQRNPAKFGN